MGVSGLDALLQERFLRLVPAETLLVGHALQNDLAALKLCHANILDTAFLFPHPKVRPAEGGLCFDSPLSFSMC